MTGGRPRDCGGKELLLLLRARVRAEGGACIVQLLEVLHVIAPSEQVQTVRRVPPRVELLKGYPSVAASTKLDLSRRRRGERGRGSYCESSVE